jgi:arylsulfatase
MNNRISLLYVLIAFALTGCTPDDSASVSEDATPPESAQLDTGQTDATDVDAGPTDNRPNILYIVADDLGFTDLGAFGSEIPTPNLDRLAYEGIRLNNFHAAAACRPSRLMMMSGVSHAAANHPLPDAGRGGVLGRDYAIIPELLKDAGYATYITGKWDLGDVAGYTPGARGFDRSFVEIGGSGSFFGRRFMDRFGYHEDDVRLNPEDLPDDFYATGYYTDRMLEFLRSTDAGQPWFAYMPYTAPHWPLQLPDDWLDRHAGNYDDGYDALRERRFASALAAGVLPAGSDLDGFAPVAEPWADLSPEEQRRYSRAQEIFAGMVEYLDMSVGRIVDYLEESGQLDNTVIVFTGDHGASAGEHGVDTGRGPSGGGGPTVSDTVDNRLENFGRPGSFIDHGRGFGEAASAPFKYQKGTIHEGGLRSASFVRYPAAVEGGSVSDTFITMMDILPTFLDIADTEHPGAGPYRDGRTINDIVGRSAWPYLTGRAEVVHTPADSAGWSGGALIRGNYKIINRPPPGGMGETPWHLYDLSVDPGERNDIAAELPELLDELVAEWETNWR